MQSSTFKLPGNWEPGGKYLLSGETLLAIEAALIKDRIVPGDGQREVQSDKGRVISDGSTAATAEASPYRAVMSQAGSAWEATFDQAYVQQHSKVADSDPVEYELTLHTVKIGEDDFDTAGSQTVAVGDEFWRKITTDENGVITGVTFEKTTDKKTIRHAPPNPIEDITTEPDTWADEAGVTGAYWHHILTFEDDGNGNPIPEYHLAENTYFEVGLGDTGMLVAIINPYPSEQDSEYRKALRWVDGKVVYSGDLISFYITGGGAP